MELLSQVHHETQAVPPPLPPLWRSLVLVLGTLVVFPAAFSYWSVQSTLQSQKVCHVGASAKNNHVPGTILGIYTPLDDASYYFVKIPYEIKPKIWNSNPGWSITTLAITVLSPQTRHDRQIFYREHPAKTSSSSMIQWDQSHAPPPPQQSSSQPTVISYKNRWCLIPGPDERAYRKASPPSVELTPTQLYQQLLSVNTTSSKVSNLSFAEENIRICGTPQASIMSVYTEAPFFIELPLSPPSSGVWTLQQNTPLEDNIEYDGGYRQKSQLSVQVQCHLTHQALPHLVKGKLAGAPEYAKNLEWERAPPLIARWDPRNLPTTLLVIIWLGVAFVSRRRRVTGNSRVTAIVSSRGKAVPLVSALHELFQHNTVTSLVYMILWVYLVGAGIEPVLGSLTYLAVYVTIVLWVALWSRGRARGHLWILVTLCILETQLHRPYLQMGPLQVESFQVLGITVNILPIFLWVGSSAVDQSLSKRRETSRTRRRKHNVTQPESFHDPSVKPPMWKYCGIPCLLLGWALANRTVLEILTAPQWTLPTALVGHATWWILHEKTEANGKQIEDEEDEERHLDDKAGDDSSVYSGRSQVETPRFSTSFMAGILTEAVLVVSSIPRLDVTLVVGSIMVTILYTGSHYYLTVPTSCYSSIEERLEYVWSVSHMMGASALIVVNSMTLAGWQLTHVLMGLSHAAEDQENGPEERNARSWMVGAVLCFHCIVQFFSLLDTAISRTWYGSPLDATTAPSGTSFWDHVQAIGEEVRLWYYIFS